jgi:phosphoribosyl 1,2-cyclic phosphodiesterase
MTSKFVILGSGNSTGVPWLHCVMDPDTRCSVCADCMDNPSTRNLRNNPCAVLQYAHPDGRTRNILIDCGKTFRDSAMRRFNAAGITSIDAVIITHPHADAYLGLDDLRDIAPDRTLPVYLSENCFLKASRAFTYLVTPPKHTGLFIASLDWRIVKPFVPFIIEDLVVTPLPVEHGEPGPMLAFEFHAVLDTSVPASLGAIKTGGLAVHDAAPLHDGAVVPISNGKTEEHADARRHALDEPSPDATAATAGDRVVYISDVAALPAQTRQYLLSKPIDLLIIDALAYKPYPTHYSFKQALLCSLDLNAREVIFVGMNHRVDYYVEQQKLEEWTEKLKHTRCVPGTGVTVSELFASSGPRYYKQHASELAVTHMQLGYDGLVMPIRLAVKKSRKEVQSAVQCSRLQAFQYAAEARSDASLLSSLSTLLSGEDYSSKEGWDNPDPTKMTHIETTTPLVVMPECECGTNEELDDIAVTMKKDLNATTYLDISLPDWEDGQSPSSSAVQKKSIHVTSTTKGIVVTEALK